jgi:FO synthase
MFLRGRSRKGPTWREALLMHAVGRLHYAGVIDNIQASWVKIGLRALVNFSTPASTTSAAP